MLPTASKMCSPTTHRKPHYLSRSRCCCPLLPRTATNARGRGGEAGRSQGVTPAKHKGSEAARCGVGNVPPCDNIERGETKSSGLEGTTYTHTMVSERRERGLPPGNLLCRCASQSRRMATSFAAGEPCITRRGQWHCTAFHQTSFGSRKWQLMARSSCAIP